MADKLITIRNFALGPDPASEAELARIKLQANGIRCFLSGKNFVSTYWLISTAEQGIKLQVRESDAAKAREILGTDSSIEPDEAENTKQQAVIPPCPECGSNAVEYEGFSKKLFYLGILFFRFPLPFLTKKYKCTNCGNTWK